MRSKKMIPWILMLLAITALRSEKLVAAGESEGAVRANHPIGAYLSLWGDPFPALWGINAAYNVYDFFRLNAGVGTDSTDRITATTFGVGGKLFVPGWALSPTVGLNWSIDNLSQNNTVDIRGLRHGGNRLYGNVGLDWQTTIGLNLGIGYIQSFASNGGGSGYVSAGFFL
jgi:hypothetical protein